LVANLAKSISKSIVRHLPLKFFILTGKYISVTPMLSVKQMKPCAVGSVRCNGSYDCVPVTGLCDSRRDCRNGWDEVKDNCPQCDLTTHFRCLSGTCIPRAWVCDFHSDCMDGSDEKLTICRKIVSILQ